MITTLRVRVCIRVLSKNSFSLEGNSIQNIFKVIIKEYKYQIKRFLRHGFFYYSAIRRQTRQCDGASAKVYQVLRSVKEEPLLRVETAIYNNSYKILKL